MCVFSCSLGHNRIFSFGNKERAAQGAARGEMLVTYLALLSMDLARPTIWRKPPR